jgi:hypothetical protein
MRDSVWDGQVQSMMYHNEDGEWVAKGMKMVLEERNLLEVHTHTQTHSFSLVRLSSITL